MPLFRQRAGKKVVAMPGTFSIYPEVRDWIGGISLEVLESNFKPVMRRAFGIQAGAVRREMLKAVAQDPGAKAAIASVALSTISLLLHRRGSFHKSGAITQTGIKRQQIGGALGSKLAIKIRRLGPFAANVDWIEPLRPYASRFMEGGNVGLANPRVRAAIHRALYYAHAPNTPVPAGDVQPARPVTEPVAAWTNETFERYVRSTVARLVSESIRKGASLNAVSNFKRRNRHETVSTLRHSRQRLRLQAARIATSV